jgi:hypothetical protein
MALCMPTCFSSQGINIRGHDLNVTHIDILGIIIIIIIIITITTTTTTNCN